MLLFGVSNHEEYQSILNEFGGKLDQGKVKYFLKLHIAYDKHNGMCKISNPLFIENLLEKYKMEGAKSKKTHMELGVNLNGIDISPEESKEVLAFGFRELQNWLPCVYSSS